MMFRHEKRSVPRLNTTSTADISFMLLILFLVSSSMDVDKGITRQLPPANPTQKQEAVTNIEKSKVMKLHIDAANQLLCDGKPMPIGSLQASAQQFISRIGKEHIIQLSTDPQASYDAYFQVQNALMAAYNSVRDAKARQAYGHALAECGERQRKSVMDAVPQRISEVYEMQEGGRP